MWEPPTFCKIRANQHKTCKVKRSMSTPSSPPVLLSSTPAASQHSADGSVSGAPIDGFAVGSSAASAGSPTSPRVRGSPGIPLTAGGPLPPFAASNITSRRQGDQSTGAGRRDPGSTMAGSPPLPPSLTGPSSPSSAEAKTSAGTVGGGIGPAPPSSTAVTAERKRALLLEARRDRLAWVDGAAAPFRRVDDNISSSFGDEGGMEALDLLGSSRACETLQSAFDVVAALYGTSLQDDDEGWSGGLSRAEAMERMRQQLEKSISEEDRKKIASAINLGRAMDGESDGSSTSPEDDEFAVDYRKFVERLKSPECADLVQGMKHFGLALRSMADAAVSDKKVCSESDVQDIASAIHGHINETLEKIRSHALWAMADSGDDKKEKKASAEGKKSSDAIEEDDKSLQKTKHVLEAFVYAINHKTIWSIVSSLGTNDEAVDNKLAALQFVTPTHLDIHHLLVGKDGAADEKVSNGVSDSAVEELKPWDVALKAPITCLQSITRQHSPGRMLSCILGAYKGVNDALSNAKVIDAGADDVLPTLILSVLRAKPSGMISSLKFIELFATPEQLRGEAGYAFTNLFGAIQFIQDLDFDEHSSEGHEDGSNSTDLKVKGLTITPEEFRKGLEKCTAELNEKKLSVETKTEADKKQNEAHRDVFDDEDDGLFDIPPSVVREARLNGETIDSSWADRWLERRRAEFAKEQAEKAENEEHNGHQMSVPKPPPLPPGFTRSYTFLSTKPEDIRMSDIPQLLHEYRMLVHASETLLAERTAKYNAEHKLHIRQMRDRMKQDRMAANDF